MFKEDSILFLALCMVPSILPFLEALVYYISKWLPLAKFSSAMGDLVPFFSSFLGVPVAIK
jgi:hypothetical protein